ncbi:MAG: 2,3-bisphosphoglycerate-independent phosphoglycerate mutase [Anaerolineae bacterium]|nr:2,3-bisphosphoglycerate-independent phosphoglycerate mutase [Anaerolineae bacterium]
MASFELIRRLAKSNGGKILLLVMDGLGGLPREQGGPTELEAAHTPNMDRLAQEGAVGLSIPVARGISPGSGPAHLALFGYDPVEFEVGRGVLSAFGVGLELGPTDVAARGNFCTVDANGLITDRRAGRIPTEVGEQMIALLRGIKLPGVEIELSVEKEYRFVFVLRGEGLNAAVSDTDPQATGVAPLPARALRPEAASTADLINQWIDRAREVLKDQHPANMLTLRGFAMDPNLPKMQDVFKLKPACVAVYPMYKGVSKLVGMDVIQTGDHDSTEDEFRKAAEIWDQYDFVFCHIKYTDSRGEDGNFDAKVKVIEGVDAALPILLDLKPDVLIITGDHSTPASYKAHSWHPVPTLLWAPGVILPDRAQAFGERECLVGGLGQFPATDLMPLALAHARRLEKFGA